MIKGGIWTLSIIVVNEAQIEKTVCVFVGFSNVLIGWLLLHVISLTSQLTLPFLPALPSNL